MIGKRVQLFVVKCSPIRLFPALQVDYFREKFFLTLDQMEIAIGIDELRWYGPTIAPFVIPMRKLFDKCCVTVYSDDFSFIDFALRVGEAEGGVGVVKWNRRASSISLNVFLDVVPQQFPEGIQEKISTRMRTAATAFAAGIEKLPVEFKGEAFLAEVMGAIDDYEKLEIRV